MAGQAEVKVEGLRQLNRALRKIDDGKTIQKDIRDRTKRLVEQTIIPGARLRAMQRFRNPAGGTYHLGAAGAATLKPFATTRAAGAQLGSSRVPYAAGAEWGSTGRNPRGRQFPARSGVSQGFVLYPVVREKEPEIIEAYVDVLGDTLSEAFPE